MEELKNEEVSSAKESDKPEDTKVEEVKKTEKLSKVKDVLFKGWKKDLKKIAILVTILVYVILVLGAISFFKGSIFGWRTDVFFKKINYKTYSHIAPDFSFKYPDYFEIDNGEGKNYGESYLAGLKLSTDPRTGCDMRLNGAGLNFKKSDKEIEDALVSDISKNAKDFNLKKAKRIKIGGEDAFSLEFTFTDPLGSKIHIDQILTGHNGTFYSLICGTGDYQYKYFEKDFQSFTGSINWNQQIK